MNASPRVVLYRGLSALGCIFPMQAILLSLLHEILSVTNSMMPVAEVAVLCYASLELLGCLGYDVYMLYPIAALVIEHQGDHVT